MVHRRLLTVMLLLLVGLVVASAVAPPPERREDARSGTTATQPTTTPAEPDDAPPARPAAPGGVTGVLPRDGTVSARAGQTIDLQVTADAAATIEIPSLAALQPASPETPAQFVVAFDRAGRYEVRNLATGRSVGTLVVRD